LSFDCLVPCDERLGANILVHSFEYIIAEELYSSILKGHCYDLVIQTDADVHNAPVACSNFSYKLCLCNVEHNQVATTVASKDELSRVGEDDICGFLLITNKDSSELSFLLWGIMEVSLILVNTEDSQKSVLTSSSHVVHALDECYFVHIIHVVCEDPHRSALFLDPKTGQFVFRPTSKRVSIMTELHIPHRAWMTLIGSHVVVLGQMVELDGSIMTANEDVLIVKGDARGEHRRRVAQKRKNLETSLLGKLQWMRHSDRDSMLNLIKCILYLLLLLSLMIHRLNHKVLIEQLRRVEMVSMSLLMSLTLIIPIRVSLFEGDDPD
jgi:hypothetical protein